MLYVVYLHTITTQFSNILLSLQVELSLQPPFIGETKCSCKAGLGQSSHLIGLLYILAHYVKMGFTSVPPTTSKTSLPQTWHVPSRALGVAPRAVSTVSVSKLKPPVINAPPQKKQRSAEGVMSNLYCPVPLPLPADELAETWLQLEVRARCLSCWKPTVSSQFLLSQQTLGTFQGDLC